MARSTASHLDLLADALRRRTPASGRRLYRIPAIWNSWGFREVDHAGQGEIAVEPHRFILDCLRSVILPARGRRRLGGYSLSRLRGVRRRSDGRVEDAAGPRRGGDWIRAASIYGLFIRASAAWDHNGDGRLDVGPWTETGTFLKAVVLLPLLARMGFDVLYLLPVNKIGQAFRKGEVGCPYSARNFFAFDPHLHDRLLGVPDREDALSIEVQFGAFIEAAHALGIRVLIDLAPRTASRDSDLLLDHPDWFYWIDAASARRYGPPRLAGFPRGIPTPGQIGELLNRPVMREHLARFRPSPDRAAPDRWREFVVRCKAGKYPDVLRGIVREFGVVTPPGFSDVVNDPQPPWSDVTFLRLFLDHPIASARHLPDPAAQPPYVFADTIKASQFPGRRPNLALWRFLARILPFYQRFGVDGARVDMGHALPGGLQRMIIAAAKRCDPDFCFLAEELDHQRAAAARRDGYNAIIGSSWWMQPRHAEGRLREFIAHVLPRAPIPMFAAAETPDTPRASVRDGGEDFARLIGVLNNFLPSAVPFVNSGMEVLERQPFNLGLDLLPRGRYALPRRDPWYGKLGYFDRVALHWTNPGAAGMVDLLAQAGRIRRQFLATLSKPRRCVQLAVSPRSPALFALGWRLPDRRTLVVAANADFHRGRRCAVSLPAAPRGPVTVLLSIHATREPPRLVEGSLRLRLKPGDVKVLLV